MAKGKDGKLLKSSNLIHSLLINIYNTDNKQTRKHTIAFYARRSTPRRLYELGVLALRELFDLGDYFELITFGEEDLPNLGLPVKVCHKGILSSNELASLYKQCTIGLVLSGTNYSLVPNEMMPVDYQLLISMLNTHVLI